MKSIKILIPSLLCISFMIACNNGNNTKQTNSSAVNDTTSNNPASDAMDYHPDQRQEIPISDSSNVIGTDTVNKEAIKDSSHK